MIQKHNLAIGSTECCVQQKFWEQVKLHPQRVALEYEAQFWCYAELANRVKLIEHNLRHKGIGHKDVVVISADRSPMLVALLLAVMQVRAIFHVVGENTPIDYVQRVLKPINRLHWISLNCESCTEEHVRQNLASKLVSFSQLPLHQWPGMDNHVSGEFPQFHSGQANDILYLSATSGSTGTPKLVVGGHEPVSHFIDWYHQHFNLGKEDRFSLLSGLGYDPMLRDIFTPLSLGATLCIPSKTDLNTKNGIAKWLKAKDVTVFNITPALGEIIFQPTQNIQLPKLRLAAIGGEVLQPVRARMICQAIPNGCLVNFYGTTETPQVMLFHILQAHEIEPSKTQAIVLGRPITDVEVLLLDNHGNQVARGESGEICIKSKYLYRGYLQPMKTKHVWALPVHQGIYHTGDLGRFDQNDDVVFVGRVDRQIKYRGHRINLEVVETVIAQFPNIVHCAVNFETRATGGASLCCYYQAARGDIESRSISQLVSKTLPSYMHPLSFIKLEKMPLTPSGKVDRQALLQVEKLQGAKATPTTAVCRNSINKVQQIWSHLLELSPEELGLSDNFFDLGGNSLLATRLIEELNKAFGKQVEVTDLFLYSNIKELSAFVSQQNAIVDATQTELHNAARMQARQQRNKAIQNRGRCSVK